MSFFGDIGDAIGGAFDWGAGAMGGIGAGIWKGMMNRDDDVAKKMMAQQVDAYKKQTELAESEISRKRDEQLAVKRQIDAKQIRALRRNFRPAGFMDASSGSGMSDKLGG